VVGVAAALLALGAFGRPDARGQPSGGSAAAPAPNGVTLALLSPPATDDARTATAIGPSGEVYEPDGKGAWVQRQRFTTAESLAIAARAGGAVVASGNGVVYRLASNGWSAIRLIQKGKAVLGNGPRAIAATGKQLLALDRLAGGEPAKVGNTTANVEAIGTGKTAVVSTDRGLFRLDGARLTAITGLPRGKPEQLVGDGWALFGNRAVDLRAARAVPLPADLAVDATTPATMAPDDSLVLVAAAGGKLELVTVRGTKVDREPITLAATGSAPSGPPGGALAPTVVGVAVDKSGRAVVALRDGRIAIRDRGTWSTTTATAALPAPRPGPPPATTR
jgi:hypothetical protein